MNLAVLLYEFVVDKPAGIPDAWPAEIKELGDSEELPGENWQLMSLADYQQYLVDNRAEYDAWDNTREAVTELDERVEKALAEAEKFGVELVQAFRFRNVKNGITVANKTKAVADYLHWLDHYLKQGSLYAAVIQLDTYLADANRAELNLSPFVTDDLLVEYKHQIQDYLHVTRT